MTPSALRWVEVDVDALASNAQTIRSRLRPVTQLMAMVKAHGYGHGLTLAAEGALGGGAGWLGVFHGQEALALREHGISAPILVVGPSLPALLGPLIAGDVDVAVLDIDDVRAVDAAAATAGRCARVHLKLDTGLGRLGVRTERVPDLARELREHGSHLEIAGIFTHFADADGPDTAFTEAQHRRFLEAVDALRPVAPAPLIHCAGSAAILRMPDTHHDMVRLGISLYGYVPPHVGAPSLRVAMSLFSRVIQVKTVSLDDTVGYGRTWRAASARRIATVGIGYGQGIRIELSNRGSVVVRGQHAPIAGRVSMDQITVDVSDVEGVEVGDEVMLFGERDGVRLGADDVAHLIGTISHEIICGVSSTIERRRVTAGSATVSV